jgi:trans-aconitate methyltransferase
VAGPDRPWHPYVFDTDRREFVGKFEDLYRADTEKGFDSWFQSDPRRLEHRLASLLLEQITFSSAIDIGCGKGAFTALLKRRDNRVTGVDLSETAIERARSYFPDIEWVCAPALEYVRAAEPVDLVVTRGTLPYLEEWRELLSATAEKTRYYLVDVYIPDGTIGFVPSHQELEAELEKAFEILELIRLPRRDVGSYLCRSKR